jgi:hypothetical protein
VGRSLNATVPPKHPERTVVNCRSKTSKKHEVQRSPPRTPPADRAVDRCLGTTCRAVNKFPDSDQRTDLATRCDGTDVHLLLQYQLQQADAMAPGHHAQRTVADVKEDTY